MAQLVYNRDLIRKPAPIPRLLPMTSRQAKAAYKAKNSIHGEKPKTWREQQEEYREQERLLREEEEKERAKRKREMKKAMKKEKERLKGKKPVVVRASQPQVTSFLRAGKGGFQSQTVDKTQEDMERSSQVRSPSYMVSANSKVLLEPTTPLSTQKASVRAIRRLTPPLAQVRCNSALVNPHSSTPETLESNPPTEAMFQPEKLANAGTFSQSPTPGGTTDAQLVQPGPVSNFKSPKRKADSTESKAPSPSFDDEFLDSIPLSQVLALSQKEKCGNFTVEGIPEKSTIRTSDILRQTTKDVTQEDEEVWHAEAAQACLPSNQQAGAEYTEAPGTQVNADKSVDSFSIFDDDHFDISSSQQAELERMAAEQEARRQQMQKCKGEKGKVTAVQCKKSMSQERSTSTQISSPDEFPLTSSQEAILLAAVESQETGKDTGVADGDFGGTEDIREGSVPIEVSLKSGELMIIDPDDFDDDFEI